MRRNILNKKGFTIIELVVTLAIVAILASAAMPLLQVSVLRNKELELKNNLREIRTAIDAYKAAWDAGRIEKKIDQTGYPPNLETLVEGVDDIKDPKKRKIKFLRKIPQDPMLPVQADNLDTQTNWGLISYDSEPNKPVEGNDVYDVFSLSSGIGTNGIPYAQW